MPHVDFSIFTSIITMVGAGIWTFMGGVTGGRRLVGWVARRYEIAEDIKRKTRDEIAKQAEIELNRRYKQQDDALRIASDQNRELWQQNKDLLDMVKSLQDEVRNIRDLLIGVNNKVVDVKFGNELLINSSENKPLV